MTFVVESALLFENKMSIRDSSTTGEDGKGSGSGRGNGIRGEARGVGRYSLLSIDDSNRCIFEFKKDNKKSQRLAKNGMLKIGTCDARSCESSESSEKKYFFLII